MSALSYESSCKAFLTAGVISRHPKSLFLSQFHKDCLNFLATLIVDARVALPAMRRSVPSFE